MPGCTVLETFLGKDDFHDAKRAGQGQTEYPGSNVPINSEPGAGQNGFDRPKSP